ncbi:MAG: phosphate/phosphite/phosphonate ABC transporter substrate-binding protein, partial [Cyanobacteria bacterium NC_groundwater_1444_Ag_S-0.65um_54_12]|nr:phosphate/phosphite/phosphonate ABC transporter substrate-binding protein [Cyanobacteria bacterium NC_groundwater_1444_Ag_S-0.65um_54_12]
MYLRCASCWFVNLLFACLAIVLLPASGSADSGQSTETPVYDNLRTTNRPAKRNHYRPVKLKIGFVPSENVAQMYRKVAPLVNNLRNALGLPVVPFVATDYPGVIEAMRSQKLDAAFLAPGAYVIAEKTANARLLLKTIRHGRDVFYSAIIVRRDSGIRSIKDLRGKRFAFGDPASMAGAIFPKVLLKTNGIDPQKDLRQLPPSGHDVTVLAVFNRQADAGAVFANDPDGNSGAWNYFLKTPEERAQIMVI